MGRRERRWQIIGEKIYGSDLQVENISSANISGLGIQSYGDTSL